MSKDYVGLVTHPWKGQYDEATWLPTLWQLLQIIEGAGWDIDEIVSELGLEMYFGGLEELMMRAAKLAVRALTKGG